MVDDYWGINCRSQDSAGKRTIRGAYSRRPEKPEDQKINVFAPDPGGSQKGRLVWARSGPHPP